MRKHGVSFETAVLVFADPCAVFDQDRIEAGELRWVAIGSVEGFRVPVVAHVVRVQEGEEVIRIISAEERIARRKGAMKKIIRHEVDLANPHVLTPAQKAELHALDAMPEKEIDYSDIPSLDASFWKNAVRNPYYRPTKTSTTVRIDSDVLLWLRSQGRGYQSKINAILRREMLSSLK